MCTSILCTNPTLKLVLPFCPSNKNGPNQPQFQSLQNLQLKLEEVQEISAGGVTLPLLIKRGEAAIREVAIAVELSNLPSKAQLGKELNVFQRQAKTAGNDLRRFNSHMDRTIDDIISINEWTARTLDGIAYDSTVEDSRGVVAKFFDTTLVPFHGLKPSTEDAVATLFMKHISQVKGDVDSLITEAGISAINLENLETQLWNIHRISERDGKGVGMQKHKETKKLAYVFGLNSEAVGDLEEQSNILRALTEQRSLAYAQVSGVLESLKVISDGLEDLRERVSMPGMASRSQTIPLEIQIDIIRRGLRRLQDGRLKIKQKKEEYVNEIREQLINTRNK
ncbi:hypothetical protein BGZ60DRAFT_489724 [Tricladium varicosporioides]|nr:hypothetical protein BGZ60DRAFT_489724 [Hymenoscyphus varicosporioides]